MIQVIVAFIAVYGYLTSMLVGQKTKKYHFKYTKIRLGVLGGRASGVGAALVPKQQGIYVFVSDAGIIKADYKYLLTSD